MSNGWTHFTEGNANGSSPWGLLPNIDAAAHWVWYAGGNCSRTDPTQGGCGAGEWLVFRIAVAATPENPNPGGGSVPEPATLALAGLELAAAAFARRRRTRAQPGQANQACTTPRDVQPAAFGATSARATLGSG